MGEHKPSMPWLGRFDRPVAVGRGGAFYWYQAARRGRDCLVAVSRPDVDPVWASEIIAGAVAAHRAVNHPWVPPSAGHGIHQDAAFVAFETAAVCDLRRLVESLDGAGWRLPVEGVAALIDALVEVFEQLAEAAEFRGATPLVGQIFGANLLFGADSRPAFVGLGSELLTGQGPMGGVQFEAPDRLAMLAGRRPLDPRADVAVVGAMADVLRARLMPKDVGAALTGPSLARWQALWGALRWDAPAERRPPDLHALRLAFRQAWRDLGFVPDATALGRAVEGLFGLKGTGLEPDAVVAERYELQQRIGFGRRQSYFLAWDRHLEHAVVIKWLTFQEERDRVRLRREVGLLREVRHPNIVGGFDLVRHGEVDGAVMEYVAGDTLDALVERGEDRVALAARLADVADAVDYLGRCGVVHRDIKPTNIIFHPQRGAVLMDLGLARQQPEAQEDQIPGIQQVETLGSYRYLAPEGALGTSAGDVYALCMVLVDLLATTPLPAQPSDDAVRAALSGRGLPESLVELMASGLCADAALRPPPRALALALRALEGPAPDASVLEISLDAAWFRFGDAEVDLRRRGPSRRLLRAIVESHRRAPEAELSVEDLIAAGWPDETPRLNSGRARVYVAINTLRRLGLESVLERTDAGYRLRPSVQIQLGTGELPPFSSSLGT